MGKQQELMDELQRARLANMLTVRVVGVKSPAMTPLKHKNEKSIQDAIEKRIAAPIHAQSEGVANLDLAHMGAMLIAQERTAELERHKGGADDDLGIDKSKQWLPFPARILNREEAVIAPTDPYYAGNKVYVLTALPSQDEMKEINALRLEKRVLKSKEKRTKQDDERLKEATLALRGKTRPSVFSLGDAGSRVTREKDFFSDGGTGKPHRSPAELSKEFFDNEGKLGRIGISNFRNYPEFETEKDEIVFNLEEHFLDDKYPSLRLKGKEMARDLPQSYQAYRDKINTDENWKKKGVLDERDIGLDGKEHKSPRDFSNELLLKYRHDAKTALLIPACEEGLKMLEDENFLVNARIFAMGMKKEIPIAIFDGTPLVFVQVASMSPEGRLEVFESEIPDYLRVLELPIYSQKDKVTRWFSRRDIKQEIDRSEGDLQGSSDFHIDHHRKTIIFERGFENALEIPIKEVKKMIGGYPADNPEKATSETLAEKTAAPSPKFP